MYIKDGICYAGELTPEIEIASIKLLKDGFMLIDFSTGEKATITFFSDAAVKGLYYYMIDDGNQK